MSLQHSTGAIAPTRGVHRTAISAARIAGISGLLFVALVIGQNIIRLAIAPANDAPVASIVDHYQNDRGLYAALGTSFAASGLALAMFIAGITSRSASEEDRAWSTLGLIGGAGVMALFSAMVACEFALLVATDRAEVSSGAVETLWTLHNSLFAVLNTMIAIALLGVGRAATRSSLVPSWLARLVPAGSALLLVGTLAGPQLAAGELQPLMGIAVLGFVIWLAVVATSGANMLRAAAD